MKNAVLICLLLLFNNCTAQKHTKINKKHTMEYFDLNKYKDWEPDSKYYRGTTRETLNKNYERDHHLLLMKDKKSIAIRKRIEKGYIETELSDITDPYVIIKRYDEKSRILIYEEHQFYDFYCKIGITKEYNKMGKLIKETNEDAPYEFSVKDLIQKFKKEYNIDLEDREKSSGKSNSVYDGVRRYPTEECYHNKPIYEVGYSLKDGYHSYFIDGTTGETLFTIVTTPYDEDIVPSTEFCKHIKSKSIVYKTINGKSYTQSEWEAYEEKQYEEYCKKTGRPYTPKNQQENPSEQDTRKSFIANDFETGDKNIPKK